MINQSLKEAKYSFNKLYKLQSVDCFDKFLEHLSFKFETWHATSPEKNDWYTLTQTGGDSEHVPAMFVFL